MNLYFGKISKKKYPDQLTDGYYRAEKDSSWFSGIQPGDYSYIIGGGKIQLWKAKEWAKKEGNDILEFDIIIDNLGINTKQLIAIKFFTLNIQLVVLTVRATASSKKAFFPIKYDEKEFNESILIDPQTYSNQTTYRNIIIKTDNNILKDSIDLQIYKESNKFKLHPSSFIDKNIIDAFKDHTDMKGGGRKNKDKTIDIILSKNNQNKTLKYDFLSIMQIYDLFCCDYKSKSLSEAEEDDIVEESDFIDIESKNIIFYGPPGTGKTYKVLNLLDELDTNEEVGFKIESIGSIDLNRTFWHLAPGRNGYLWTKLKKENRLGYEWCRKTLGDLKKLDPSIENYKIRKRFSEVKKGDYFCIVRGRQCLAIAEAQEDYKYSENDKSTFDFQTVEVRWLAQFETPILLNTSSTKTFSGINDGQRWKSLKDGLIEKGFTFGEVASEKPVFKKLYKFTTFHQSYSYEDFIEGIKPRLIDDTNEEENEQKKDLEYEIKPGVFYNSCDKAAQLAGYSDLQEAMNDSRENRKNKFSKAQPYYLIIDEINRGNVANIFGELITLIEKDKRLGAKQETILSLPYSKDYFGVPGNLIIIGTMNTADRSVEALDTALRRRFTFEFMPTLYHLTELQKEIAGVFLPTILQTINQRITYLMDEDHQIGHSYFLDINDQDDIKNIFRNSVIPLLKEYFYNDFGKIRLVLGDGFVEVKSEKPKFTVSDVDLPEREQYRIKIDDPDFNIITALKKTIADNS